MAMAYGGGFPSRFMSDEIYGQAIESLRLPKGRRSSVQNAVLKVIGIVRIAMLAGREALIAKGDAKDARMQQSRNGPPFLCHGRRDSIMAAARR